MVVSGVNRVKLVDVVVARVHSVVGVSVNRSVVEVGATDVGTGLAVVGPGD